MKTLPLSAASNVATLAASRSSARSLGDAGTKPASTLRASPDAREASATAGDGETGTDGQLSELEQMSPIIRAAFRAVRHRKQRHLSASECLVEIAREFIKKRKK